jgi:hypothetical protein
LCSWSCDRAKYLNGRNDCSRSIDVLIRSNHDAHYKKSGDLWHFLGDDSSFHHKYNISETICKISSWIIGGPERLPNWMMFLWRQHHLSSQIKTRNHHRSTLGPMTNHVPSQIKSSNHHRMTLGSMIISFCHNLENLKVAELSVKSLERISNRVIWRGGKECNT